MRANGLTLTGLLFGRRGLGLLGRSGRVEYSIHDIMFPHNVRAYTAIQK